MAAINIIVCVNISLFIVNHDSDSSSSSEESDEHSDNISDEEQDEYTLHSELEILYAVLMVGETRGETVWSEKISDYVEHVIPGYSRHVFKEHFRMFPETFEEVLRIISPGLRAINTEGGRNPIPMEKQLLVAIWFIATPDSYRSVSTKFGIGKGTAFRALRRVTYALHCIAPRLIQWPKTRPTVTKVMEQFRKACGFPNVIGAIDGTHVYITVTMKW
ncbi:PREDICTED: uncharacterized protein LOC108772029 [Cyphomyrmex costatus]|uniref:uncharacterized protein LOC108772029 n=1 Tax=Cyphomyrmex costatus TaxID=456900 RepID=UPI0008522FB6|nr:PREDICTED: uncharacterized protein LOC108772029 [Cyphomyrmex costatus]